MTGWFSEVRMDCVMTSTASNDQPATWAHELDATLNWRFNWSGTSLVMKSLLQSFMIIWDINTNEMHVHQNVLMTEYVSLTE